MKVKVKPISPFVWEILTEVQKKEASVLDVGRKISFDPVLSALVIKACKAAIFGISQPVKSPVHAVSLLGLERVREIVSGYAVRSLVEGNSKKGEVLWRHLIEIAYAGQNIVRFLGMDLDLAEVFTAGLFHDLGKIAFLEEEEFECFGPNRKERLEKERELKGKTHVEIGSEIIRDWPLPDSVKRAIERHHGPVGNDCPLGRVLILAHDLVYNETLPEDVVSSEGAERIKEMYRRDTEAITLFFEE